MYRLSALVLLAACAEDPAPIEDDGPSLISATLDAGTFDPGSATWTSTVRVVAADRFDVVVQPVDPEFRPAVAELTSCSQAGEKVTCGVSVPFAASDDGSDVWISATSELDEAVLHAAWLPIVPR
jgi:hypothetical protein